MDTVKNEGFENGHNKLLKRGGVKRGGKKRVSHAHESKQGL